MGGHHFQEILCVICSKPLDLTTDLCADEHGKAVHDECYAHTITLRHNPPQS
jgi:hypothetical protein